MKVRRVSGVQLIDASGTNMAVLGGMKIKARSMFIKGSRNRGGKFVEIEALVLPAIQGEFFLRWKNMIKLGVLRHDFPKSHFNVGNAGKLFKKTYVEGSKPDVDKILVECADVLNIFLKGRKSIKDQGKESIKLIDPPLKQKSTTKLSAPSPSSKHARVLYKNLKNQII